MLVAKCPGVTDSLAADYHSCNDVSRPLAQSARESQTASSALLSRVVNLKNSQEKVNAGATCFQIAPIYLLAAALKNALMAAHDGADDAAAACGASIQDCFPVYEMLLELCIRCRDGTVVDTPFVLSVGAAVDLYVVGFSPYAQNDAGAFLGCTLAALRAELNCLIPFLTTRTPVTACVSLTSGRSLSPFMAVMAMLASFLAPLLLRHAALDASWAAGVCPELVPLHALLASDPSSWRVGDSDCADGVAVQSARICAGVVLAVAAAPRPPCTAPATAVFMASLGRRDLGPPSAEVRSALQVVASTSITAAATSFAAVSGTDCSSAAMVPSSASRARMAGARASIMKACDEGELAACLCSLPGSSTEIASVASAFSSEDSSRLVAAAAR